MSPAVLLVAFSMTTPEFSLPASGWEKLARALQSFSRAPSEENCKAVDKLLPASMHLMYDDSPEAQRALEQLEAALPTLEHLVTSKSRLGVGLAFRLFVTMSDGHLAEELDIILGKLIRLDPVMFLEELQSVRPAYPVEGLDGLVGNLGDEFVDDFKGQCEQLHLRLKAIESVDRRDLAQVRGRCERALIESLKGTCDAA